MSFSSQVKNELAAYPRKTEQQRHALMYGLFLFAGSFSEKSMFIRTENEQVVNIYTEYAQSVGSVPVRKSVSKSGLYTCEVVNRLARQRILRSFGAVGNEPVLRINRSNIDESAEQEYNCEAAFLAGAFLSCGGITDPKRDYRLEFIASFKNLSRDILKMLRDIDVPDSIEPRQTVRKGNYVIYLKNSQNIEDALTFMGAPLSALSLMETKVYKDIRNKVNRISNCENANLDKSIDAGIRQVKAIRKIVNILGEEGIPENCRELATVRVNNPQMSLSQLCEELTVPVSRSGVNHRLNKLIKIAEEL